MDSRSWYAFDIHGPDSGGDVMADSFTADQVSGVAGLFVPVIDESIGTSADVCSFVSGLNSFSTTFTAVLDESISVAAAGPPVGSLALMGVGR